MLKQKRQLIEFLYMISDLVFVSIAWVFAYYLRFQTQYIPVLKGIPDFNHYLLMLIFICPIWIFVFRKTGLYKPMRGVRRVKEIFAIVNANIFSVIILIALTYLFREKSVPFSRLVFLYFVILATFFTLIQRLALRTILKEIRRRGYNIRYLLVVGSGDAANNIISKVRMQKDLGIQLLGCLTRDGTSEAVLADVNVLGKYFDIKNILKNIDIDQIVISLPLEDSKFLPEIMDLIGDKLIDIRIVPDLHKYISLGGTIEEFEGLPIINLQDPPLSGVNLIVKRFLDFFVAFFSLILISPFLLIVSILIKLTSRGSIFYGQERVSLDGTTFKIYKFRTMKMDSEKTGPGWTTPKDERVTWFGKILRRTNIDELPQLINVLRGNMSLVGPRPERPVYIAEFRKKIPNYMLRHKVPAGLTGWAQINGWRGDTSIDKRLEFDLDYIKNWSILLDLKILFMTVFKTLGRKNNAY